MSQRRTSIPGGPPVCRPSWARSRPTTSCCPRLPQMGSWSCRCCWWCRCGARAWCVRLPDVCASALVCCCVQACCVARRGAACAAWLLQSECHCMPPLLPRTRWVHLAVSHQSSTSSTAGPVPQGSWAACSLQSPAVGSALRHKCISLLLLLLPLTPSLELQGQCCEDNRLLKLPPDVVHSSRCSHSCPSLNQTAGPVLRGQPAAQAILGHCAPAVRC